MIIFDRFKNENIGDKLERIAMDGVGKFPIFIQYKTNLPSISLIGNDPNTESSRLSPIIQISPNFILVGGMLSYTIRQATSLLE